MNWYPDRKDLAQDLLESSGDVTSRFKAVSKTPHNATSALLRHDLITVCSKRNAVPIFLPKIDESFTENFCALVWNLYKNDAVVVEQFCQNQPRNRTADLLKEIEVIHTSDCMDRVPDIGLYDAYQILSSLSDAVVLISLEADPLFTKKHRNLVTGIELFLHKSKNAIAVLALSRDEKAVTNQERKHSMTAFYLPDINSELYVDHAIETAKQVSPHLEISRTGATHLYSLCGSVEEFISGIQEMVLYQKENFAFLHNY